MAESKSTSMVGFVVLVVAVLLGCAYLGWRIYDSPVEPGDAGLVATQVGLAGPGRALLGRARDAPGRAGQGRGAEPLLAAARAEYERLGATAWLRELDAGVASTPARSVVEP